MVAGLPAPWPPAWMPQAPTAPEGGGEEPPHSLLRTRPQGSSSGSSEALSLHRPRPGLSTLRLGPRALGAPGTGHGTGCELRGAALGFLGAVGAVATQGHSEHSCSGLVSAQLPAQLGHTLGPGTPSASASPP